MRDPGLDCLVVVPAGEARLVCKVLSEDCDLLVIDAAGDYRPLGRERALRLAHDPGRVAAMNIGLDHGFVRGYARVVLLDAGVVLSRDFIAGLVQGATLYPGSGAVGMVGPLCDDQIGNGQFFDHDPAAFLPYDETFPVPALVPACVLWTRAAWDAVGPMDEAAGARAVDRAVEAACHKGLRVLCSKLSYLRGAARPARSG
jgi:GT2 family glycosyltransferase